MSKIKIVFISLFAFVATLLSGVWIGNYSLMLTVPLFSSQNTIEVSNFSEHELRIQFERFISRYTKSYVDSNEYEARFLIFKNNYRQIERHNSESIAHKYTLRMNKFGDLTQEEFKNKYLGLLPSQGYTSKNSESGSNTNKTITLKIPTSVDWREKGVVSGVKDQKSCKSGWAFSAISTIESAFRISGQGNDLLSEQQLIDCTDTSQYRNEGCGGGRVAPSYDYAHVQSLCSSHDYAYLGANDNCRDWKLCNTKYFVRSFVSVQPKNRIGLYNAIAQQPVSIAVDASSLEWQFYSGGIFNNRCTNDVNHSVTAVGYNSYTYLWFWNYNYIIIKNSWGTSWGDGGYLYLSTDSDEYPGLCGAYQQMYYPSV